MPKPKLDPKPTMPKQKSDQELGLDVHLEEKSELVLESTLESKFETVATFGLVLLTKFELKPEATVDQCH